MNHLLVQQAQRPLYFVKFHYQKGTPKVNHWTKVGFLALILSMVGASGVRADQVDVTLDLTVTSQTTLAFVSLEMQVTAATGTPLFLDPTQQPTSFLTDPSYVFSGQSFDAEAPLPYWMNFSSVTPFGSQIVGGDSTANFLDVTLAPGNYLLALVTYDNETQNGAAGPFQVSPVTDTGNTFFQDQNSTPYSFTYGFDADTNTGTFTISAASVPEPASSTMLAISSGLGGLLWYRRHRKASVKAD